jgi:aminocarboxymuconate-semialdehyde decarboxylase
MNIDLHSPFFPLDALQRPDKYENRAPQLVLNNGRLTSRHGLDFARGFLPERTIPAERIKALDEMQIDLQAISPSPILLLYWEEPRVAAHFSRKQNEAIQGVVQKHPDRFVGLGNVPLQSVQDAIAIAQEAKSLGVLGLETATPSVTGRSTTRASHRSSKRFKSSTCYCSFIRLRAALTPMIRWRRCSATFYNSPFGRP